jgi:hypothetical protein
VFTTQGSSTHYGNDYQGACGFQAAMFCNKSFKYDDPNAAAICKNVPDELKEGPMGGFFAAPSGYYYTQKRPDGSTYLSCGECYEIEIDETLTPDYTPSIGPNGVPSGKVVVQIVDACPAGPNTEWCAGPYSTRPGLPGLGPASLHLDLSDASMGVLSTGDPNAIYKQLKNVLAVAATKYRRVACPITTSMYMALTYVSLSPASTHGFYGMGFGIANVAGAGSLFKVEIQGSQEPGPVTGKYCYQFAQTCNDEHSCNVQSDNPNCPGVYSDDPDLCIPANAKQQFFKPACTACASYCGLSQEEAERGSSEWINCLRGVEMVPSRPQEESGIWQFNTQLFAPVRLRITDSKNRVVVTDWIPYESFLTQCNTTTQEGCFIRLTTNNGADIAQFPATLPPST